MQTIWLVQFYLITRLIKQSWPLSVWQCCHISNYWKNSIQQRKYRLRSIRKATQIKDLSILINKREIIQQFWTWILRTYLSPIQLCVAPRPTMLSDYSNKMGNFWIYNLAKGAQPNPYHKKEVLFSACSKSTVFLFLDRAFYQALREILTIVCGLPWLSLSNQRISNSHYFLQCRTSISWIKKRKTSTWDNRNRPKLTIKHSSLIRVNSFLKSQLLSRRWRVTLSSGT